jgi:cobalamin-dependent methionine synthase I
MAKIKINGAEYDLRMSLWASEQIEKEYGDLKEALQQFRKERKIGMVKYMFAVMANAGRRSAKQPADVTPEALDDCTLADLDAIAQAMREAMDETMHAETVGGNEADDETQDALAAEYDEKNGLTGGE